MRVALDATPLAGVPTGVAAFVRGLLPALLARGDLDVVAFGLTARGRARLTRAVPAGVQVRTRPVPARVLLEAWARVDWPAAEWITGAVEVVHGTNFVVPPPRRAGAVVTVHDLTAVRFPAMCTPASRRYPSLVRRAVGRGAVVHTHAEAVAEEVRDWLGGPAGVVRAVPPGPSPVPPSPGDAGAGRRMVGAHRYVLALGTVEPRKGLPGLVRAFDRLAGDRPDLVLAVAGPDGWGSAQLGEAIASARHGRRVRRLGWVGEQARADLLAGATVVAVPSVYEGWGFPALEAMAAGTPVVASASGALPEVVGEAGRLVAPGDDEALAGALAGVVDDEAAALALARAGPGRASRFRWEDTAAGLVELYRGAAQGQW